MKEIEEMGLFLLDAGDSEDQVREIDFYLFQGGVGRQGNLEVDVLFVLVPLVSFLGLYFNDIGHLL